MEDLPSGTHSLHRCDTGTNVTRIDNPSSDLTKGKAVDVSPLCTERERERERERGDELSRHRDSMLPEFGDLHVSKMTNARVLFPLQHALLYSRATVGGSVCSRIWVWELPPRSVARKIAAPTRCQKRFAAVACASRMSQVTYYCVWRRRHRNCLGARAVRVVQSSCAVDLECSHDLKLNVH